MSSRHTLFIALAGLLSVVMPPAALGLDIGDPTFWDGGLALLEDMVVQAEELAGQVSAR